MNLPVKQAERGEPAYDAPAKLPPITAGFFDIQSFELMQRVARGFAVSSLVPQMYRGNSPEAIGNCMIALNLARRTGADPLMVMQNLAIVQGRPSWSSQFLIASVNTCGRFTALRFEFFGEGEGYGCRAWAIEKATGERLVGADITIALAKAEGWYGRNGSKWKTMAQQMLIYRAGAWWTKAYAPEISMGLMTADEAEDVIELDRAAYKEVPALKERPKVQSINDRLANFAGKTVESDAPKDEFAAGHTPQPAAEEPPAVEPQPAGGSSSPVEEEVAAEPETERELDPIGKAFHAGRDAYDAGVDPKNMPSEFKHYTSYSKAWRDGYKQRMSEIRQQEFEQGELSQ